MPRRPDLVGVLLLCWLGLLWGLTPAIGKLAVEGGWGPLAFAFWQAVGAALILGAIALWRGAPLPSGRRGFSYALAQGLLGFAAPNAIAISALAHIPAGLFAMMTPLAPILTVLLSAALGLERISRQRALGIGAGFAGAALALNPAAALPDPAQLPWALIAGLCPCCYAVSNIIAVRFKPKGIAPLGSAVATTGAAALWLGPAMLIAGQTRVPMLPAIPADALVPLQAVLMALAFLGYFKVIGRAGAVFASQVGYVILPAGTLWGVLLFSEQPGWLALPAGLLIAVGLALVGLDRRKGGGLPPMKGV